MAIFTAITFAIQTVASWTISLGALGTFAVGNFLLRAAVQLGVSALAKAFAGDGPQAEPFSIQGSVRTGGAVPRSFILGPGLSAGSLVWHSEWGTVGGTPNAYYTQVIALSDLPVTGLARWFIEGQAVTLEDTGDEKGLAAVEYRENGVDHAWIRFHDGNQSAADSFLTGTVGPGAPRDYSVDRIGVGIAYAIVTFRVNQEIFTGFPRSKFVLNGVKLYDITKDDTAGGSGSHRWDDPATWGGDGDDLPAVQAYNLARGLTFAGDWFYGLQGLTAARLPAAHWISQIDKCRADGGDGFPIYRCAGEITVNSEIGSAFEAILTACAGRMSEVGGIFKIYVGAPDAPIAHITDKDIVSLAPQTFTPFHGLSGTVNGVIASYPSPDEGYVMRSTPPIYNPAFEAEDGKRRLMTDVQLSFVPFPVQVQRLLQGELAAARRARRHTFTLPARFRLIEPGDVVTWTSERNGYGVKQFRVDGVVDLPNCDLIVDITEVDPADHGQFNIATDYTPVAPSPLVSVRPTVQGVVGFNPVATDVQDAAGTPRRAAILMRWTGAVEDIAGIMFEVRLAGAAEVIARAETRDFQAGELLVEAGLVGATAYECRAQYIPASPRLVSWTSWVPVATNDVRFVPDDFGPESIEWSALAQTVRDQIDSAGDASASAELADAARIASEAARDGAQAEAAQSDAARIASEAARNEAQASAASAGGSASAAAGYASAAAASETAAGSSASAAESSRLAAETAKTGAQSSASAAASSASAALASETAAGSSASAAESSRLAVEAVARQSLPSTFDQDGAFFINGYTGGVDAPDLGAPFTFVDVAGAGRVAQVIANGVSSYILSNRGFMPVSNGRTYKLRLEVRQTAGSTDGNEINLQFRGYANTGFGSGGGTNTGSFAITALNQWFAFEHEMTVLDADEYPIRRGLYYVNSGSENGDTFQFRICSFEDITESAAAEFSASAAASSASAAAASQSAAGSSASAANSSKLAAETARSGAQVAENSAVAAADAAGDAAAGAQVARDVAVSVSQQGAGMLRNQFTDDDGTWTAFGTGPTFVANEVYQTGKTMVWNLGATGNAGATTYSYRPGWARAGGDQRVRVDIEFELVSGDLSGTGFRVDWENTQGTEFVTPKTLTDMLSEPLVLGRVMMASAIFERPGNFTGTFSRFQLYLFANYAGGPNGPLSAKHIKVHRVQIYPLAVTDANTHAAQAAIADLQGNALASFVFRAKAGGATGAVEIVAASDPEGASASKVKLTGDEIEFDGMAVFKDNLQSDNYAESGGVPTAGFRLSRDGTFKGLKVITTEALADNAATVVRESKGSNTQTVSWTPDHDGSAVAIAFCQITFSTGIGNTVLGSYALKINGVTERTVSKTVPNFIPQTDYLMATLLGSRAITKNVPITISMERGGNAAGYTAHLVILERRK